MLHKAIRISIILVIIAVTGLIFSYYFREIPKRTFSEINHFEDDKQKNWTTIFPEYISDMQYYSQPTSYKLTEKMEWGPSFSIPVREMGLKKSDQLDISVYIFCSDSIPPEVVVMTSLKSGQEQIYQQSANMRNFWIHPGWNNLILSLSLKDLPLSKKDLEFNTYIWNKGLRKIFIDDYEIRVR